MAATFDRALVRRTNEITAYETRASGIPWNFSPVLDLGRQPLWPRYYETFGEDPYVASVMGVEAVLGNQRDPWPALAPLLGAGAAAAEVQRPGVRRRVGEALPRLLDAAQRQGPHDGVDPRARAARVLPAELPRRDQARGSAR